MKGILTLSFLLITLVTNTSCGEVDELGSGIVRYEVTCSPSGFDITYGNSFGNTEQREIILGRWTTSFSGNKGDFVYISAQADNENATIAVAIYYEGKVIEQAVSSGDYVVVTVSGSLP